MSKKGGKAKETKETTYEIRDIVLGKIRGYPPWPGMVVDPDGAPPQVQKERPSGKKNTFYCVRFFPAGDYSWLVPKDMSKLQKHEIESYVGDAHKKTSARADLLNGYRIALDPEPWEEEKRKAAEAAIAQLEQDESEEDHDQDQLASGTDDSGSTSKKRKRSASAKSKKVAAKAKGGKKSKAMIESEDDGEGEEDEEVISKPPTKKAKTAGAKSKTTNSKSSGKDKGMDEEESEDPEAIKVKDWRHRLQKTFLSNNKPDIRAQDMPAMDELFKQIETYDKMTIECLSFSKIGKVMRHITSIPAGKIPTESESQYRFKERAKLLMEKWHVILNSTSEPHSSGHAAGVNGNAISEDGGAVNGEMGMGLGDMSVMSALPDTTMEVDADNAA